MCNNCIHKAVCSIYRATGGVKKCEHFKEERKGEWAEINQHKDVEGWIECDYLCSACGEIAIEWFDYCPYGGADMRGAEDGK